MRRTTEEGFSVLEFIFSSSLLGMVALAADSSANEGYKLMQHLNDELQDSLLSLNRSRLQSCSKSEVAPLIYLEECGISMNHFRRELTYEFLTVPE